jgi:hypothetical protein
MENVSRVSEIKNPNTQVIKEIKKMVMKFLLIILTVRFVFYLLGRPATKRSKVEKTEYEEDWSNPSEHNVWW